MSKWGTPLGVAGTAVALTVFASPLVGQDCGRECVLCSAGWFEGRSYDPSGGYDMACMATEEGCLMCGEQSVNHPVLDAAVVARTIEVATGEEMGAVVAADGRRLSVHSARGLVAVRGTRCSEHAVAFVVFVGSRKAEVLSRLGVRQLTDVLN